MAITFPNGIKPTTMTITSEQQTVESHGHSFHRQARTRGGHRWTVEYDYPKMTRSSISQLIGFIHMQAGRAGTFTINPAKSLFGNNISGAANGSGVGYDSDGYALQNYLPSGAVVKPSVDIASTARGGGMLIGNSQATNLSLSNSKVEAGTFVKFSNHSKVYMLTRDIEFPTASQFAAATLTVESQRQTNSPKLNGDILIDIPAIDGSGTDTTATTVTVATLATDDADAIAGKIETALTSALGSTNFTASSSGDTVTLTVKGTGRNIFVNNLLTFTTGITGIEAEIDNLSVIGGADEAFMYFDPPLRTPVTTDTTVSIGQIDDVPFKVSLGYDSWTMHLDESEHYKLRLTFTEVF